MRYGHYPSKLNLLPVIKCGVYLTLLFDLTLRGHYIYLLIYTCCSIQALMVFSPNFDKHKGHSIDMSWHQLLTTYGLILWQNITEP